MKFGLRINDAQTKMSAIFAVWILNIFVACALCKILPMRAECETIAKSGIILITIRCLYIDCKLKESLIK